MNIRGAVFWEICVIAALFSGCAGTGSSKNNFDTKRISLIVPHVDNRYWSLVVKGAQVEADVRGFSFEKQEPISSSDNVQELTQIVYQCIDAGTDAILVRADEDEDFAEAIASAQEAGIVVGFLDANSENIGHDFYVGTDNVAAGRELGESVCDALSGAGKICLITAKGTMTNLEERERGFLEACEEYSDIVISEILDDNWNSAVALGQIKSWIDSGDTDAIVALEGYGTLALNTFVEGADQQETLLFGFDYDSEHYYEAVKKGKISGIITQQPFLFGQKGVEMLALIWDGKMEEDISYISTVYVDMDNVDSFVEEGV